jgi:hypothetical protein
MAFCVHLRWKWCFIKQAQNDNLTSDPPTLPYTLRVDRILNACRFRLVTRCSPAQGEGARGAWRERLDDQHGDPGEKAGEGDERRLVPTPRRRAAAPTDVLGADVSIS